MPPAPRRCAGIHDAINDFKIYLTTECGLAPATLEAYGRDLKELTAYLESGGTGLEDIDFAVMQHFMIHLQKRGLAISSIARRLACMKVFLRYCYGYGLLDNDVATILESPKKWKRLPHTHTYNRVRRLLEAPEVHEPYYLRDRAMLELLYASGMRVSECAGLQLGSINLEIGYVRVFGKGRKERVVPIGRAAIDTLRAYLEGLRPKLVRRPQEAGLFLSRTGRPLDRTGIWRLVSKYVQRAGIEGKLSPHTLRHCFATHLLAGGADLRVVQALLGHADVTTTEIYTHVDRSGLKGIHRKFHPLQ